MAEPIHNPGTFSHLPHKTIATFPAGSFLENLAVRHDGTLLVSNMTAGEIYHLDPHAADPQSTIQTICSFNSDRTVLEAGGYGSGCVAEAIVEDSRTPDVFYTMSGKHGVQGTWAVYRLDLRGVDLSQSGRGDVQVRKIAEVPDVQWLNGATFLAAHNILLMAESLQGKLIACDVVKGEVETWLDHDLLGKVTTRPPWPGVNGLQFFRGSVFMTSSDRALVLKAGVGQDGKYREGSLEVLVEDLTGDDLAFDGDANLYVATNPGQSVMKLRRIGPVGEGKGDWERVTILGGNETEETAGPTAVAFGRTEKDMKTLFVVTTGGIVNPVNGKLGLARVLSVDVGVEGEGV